MIDKCSRYSGPLSDHSREVLPLCLTVTQAVMFSAEYWQQCKFRPQRLLMESVKISFFCFRGFT